METNIRQQKAKEILKKAKLLQKKYGITEQTLSQASEEVSPIRMMRGGLLKKK